MNPWGFVEDEGEYEHFVTKESFKGKFKNEASFIIKSISYNDCSNCIYCFKIKYQGGQESQSFGDSGWYPTLDEITLPQKPISKIHFHKGREAGGFDPGPLIADFLGGLTIFFIDGTSQKIGQYLEDNPDTDYKSVDFRPGQYWVGLRTKNNYKM